MILRGPGIEEACSASLDDFSCTMDRESLVKSTHRCTKCLKQEIGVILTTTFLVFLFRIIFVVVTQSDEPFFMMVNVTYRPAFSSSIDVNTSEPDEGETMQDTYMTGTEAVKSFQAHLECFSESGKWVYNPTPRHLPWNYVGDPYASSCDWKHVYATPGLSHVANGVAEDIALRGAPGNWSVREELQWVWQTNASCPWRPMNRDDFCRKIGSKRHVMLVGDSINHQISWAIMNALLSKEANETTYPRLYNENRVVPGPYEMCGDIFGEGNGFNVSFVRNDRLSPIVDEYIDTEGNFYDYPWLHFLEELGIKTLILNRGAHYEDDEKYTSALRTIFTTLSQDYAHIHVIYRNTQPGHLDCMNFTQPLLQPQQGVSIYHWEDFRRQNLLAKEIVDEFHYTYMDSASMLTLRADGHIWEGDCLHYCVPGPLDLVSEYLYNILLLM